MAYIGPEPNPGQNREVDDISSGFNGSEVNFTLQVNSQNVSPGSPNNIIVSLGGVVQNPSTDYNIAASTITFTTAPASGLSFFGVVLGQQVDIQSLADGTSPTMSAPSITGDLSIADKIVHTGDTNTAIRFPAADTVSFETGGSEAARFDLNGNLLVGATSYQNGGFGGTSSGINVAGTQPQVLLHETDTDKDGYFGLAASILRIQTADSIPVTIWTNDTKRINVHETTGDTTLETGNLVIGTAGKGIDFSASANNGGMVSEILNDYERGTFTATITGIGGGTNPTFTAQTSSSAYIKIGDVVHYWIYIFDINCTNSGSGTITTVSGLPFASGGHYYPGVITHNTVIGNGNVNGGYVQANSSSPHFIPIVGNTTSGSVANTGTPLYIMIGGAYTSTVV